MIDAIFSHTTGVEVQPSPAFEISRPLGICEAVPNPCDQAHPSSHKRASQ